MHLIRRLVLLILVPAFLAGAVFAQAKATPDEAKALAEKAVAHIKAAGPEKAFADFNARDGKWTDRELYIIVIGFDGMMLVHGTLKAIVGKQQLEMKDMNGKFMSKEMLDLAKSKGSGWVDYMWSNPVTKKIDPKSTYVLRIPGFDGFLGVGIYK